MEDFGLTLKPGSEGIEGIIDNLRTDFTTGQAASFTVDGPNLSTSQILRRTVQWNSLAQRNAQGWGTRRYGLSGTLLLNATAFRWTHLHAGCSENTYRLIVSGGVDSELSLISTEKPRRLRHRK
jgi:hypothetical protein